MKTRQQAYEESGKRPGKPVGTRLTETQLERLDFVRGDESRSSFVNRVTLAAIGWNAPRRRGRSGN